MGYYKKLLDNCDKVSLLALKGKEDKLTWKERWWMRSHIFFCKCCKNFTKQSTQIDVSLKEHFKELDKKPQVKASDNFKAKMKEKLS